MAHRVLATDERANEAFLSIHIVVLYLQGYFNMQCVIQSPHLPFWIRYAGTNGIVGRQTGC